MSPGLLFLCLLFSVTLYPQASSMFFIVIRKINASPFSKSPPRKFPSCALEDALFLSTLNWELSSFFSSIHKGKAFLPMLPLLPSASYPSRILTLKARLFDADLLVT